MILEVLFYIFSRFVLFFTTILPDVPEMPSVIDDIFAFLGDILVGGLGFFYHLVGGWFLVATLVALLGLLTFESLYRIIMYVIKKIPIINLK